MTASSTWKWNLAQALELRWWKKYLKNKDRNHYLHWKASYWDNLLFDIEKYIELPEHFTILDAGCGPAGIFICLKRNQVVAIDPLMEKYLTNGLLEPENYPWVQFKTEPIEDMPYSERFDYIFCLNAINHVKDIEKSYDALVRALKPGGTLILSTDAHKNNFMKKIFQLIPGDMLHPVQLNIDEYNEHLRKRNLDIITSILYKEEPIFDYYITIARKK